MMHRRWPGISFADSRRGVSEYDDATGKLCDAGKREPRPCRSMSPARSAYWGMARRYVPGHSRKAVNVVARLLLTIGIGPKSTYLLTTAGGRTGQQRKTPVTLVEDGEKRWLVAPYGTVSWVHNVRRTPTIELRRGRRRIAMHAAEVDAATAGPILRCYAKQVPVTRPYFDAAPSDDVAAFVAEAQQHPVFLLGPGAQ
jgi:deazaflavin-dependent oxidoreductase (nitroreductase family)